MGQPGGLPSLQPLPTECHKTGELPPPQQPPRTAVAEDRPLVTVVSTSAAERAAANPIKAAATARDGSAPLDPMSFLQRCSQHSCLRDFETVENEEDSEDAGVTRTFRWRPEDCPVEDATYMQCEEPWQANRGIAVFKEANSLPAEGFISGMAQLQKLSQVGEFQPDVDADEETVPDEAEGG